MKFLALMLMTMAFSLSHGTEAKAMSAASACPGHVKAVYFYRGATRQWERKLGHKPSRSNFNAAKIRSCKYVVWVAHSWEKRAVKARKAYEEYLKSQARLYSDPEYAICSVFGKYCSGALTVAWCEGKYSPYASNGQYQGTFQMGEKERATYGHGGTVLEQARAAWRYFVASGKDWSPWECKP